MAQRQEEGSSAEGPGDGTSETAPTYDPLGTVPDLGGERPPASFAAAERYRLLGTLGEGGMGVVYRAEDTRLGRTVAVKTIPAARTANRWAKERFLDEARAASALDHPNLCTIYEIEETSAGQLFLTMPCYDGETLRSRLERGALPLPEAVQIVQQVARGLAKVHALGMVHCDLKPANLMLTGDGLVKILDFGIARLSGPSPHLPAGPYGTPGYRSPEQARGDEVDPASDVWSLGVILYEMVTGRAPGRDERGETLPWDEIDPTARQLAKAPPQLGHLLSRMLARQPGERYQDAAALLVDLERLTRHVDPPSGDRRELTRRGSIRAAILGLTGLCLVSLGGFLRFEGHAPARRASPSTEPSLALISEFIGEIGSPSLSPDGRRVVYSRLVGGRHHIFSQAPVLGAKAVDLTADSPADDFHPRFSPDGRQIAFVSERDGGGIFLMPAQGGPVRRLTRFGFHPDWSPDGREIACDTSNFPIRSSTPSEIFRIDVTTGAKRWLAGGDAQQPSWSPHGQRIAYLGFLPRSGHQSVLTISAEGGAAVPAVDDLHTKSRPAWAPDGRYLYFASDRSGTMTLWRLPIDEASGRVRGEPEAVTIAQQEATSPSLSQDGRLLVYRSDSYSGRIEKIGFDPAKGQVNGPAESILETSTAVYDVIASRDGRWLAYNSWMPGYHARNGFETFLMRPDGSRQQQIFTDQYDYDLTDISPDSSHVAFTSNRGGIWTIRVDNSVPTREIAVPSQGALWSPDGKTLACNVKLQGKEALIDLTKPPGQRALRFLPPLESNAGFIATSWSSDGKWLAGSKYRNGTLPGILLYSLADRRYVQLLSHGDSPVWLHDNQSLLYYDGYNNLNVVDVRTGRSQPVPLPASDSSFVGRVEPSPDDRFLYVARTKVNAQLWLLTLR